MLTKTYKDIKLENSNLLNNQNYISSRFSSKIAFSKYIFELDKFENNFWDRILKKIAFLMILLFSSTILIFISLMFGFIKNWSPFLAVTFFILFLLIIVLTLIFIFKHIFLMFRRLKIYKVLFKDPYRENYKIIKK